jgi:hypothetical protein
MGEIIDLHHNELYIRKISVIAIQNKVPELLPDVPQCTHCHRRNSLTSTSKGDA